MSVKVFSVALSSKRDCFAAVNWEVAPRALSNAWRTLAMILRPLRMSLADQPNASEGSIKGPSFPLEGLLLFLFLSYSTSLYPLPDIDELLSRLAVITSYLYDVLVPALDDDLVDPQGRYLPSGLGGHVYRQRASKGYQIQEQPMTVASTSSQQHHGSYTYQHPAPRRSAIYDMEAVALLPEREADGHDAQLSTRQPDLEAHYLRASCAAVTGADTLITAYRAVFWGFQGVGSEDRPAA
ncbi:hypothetical protein BDV12DRAFT_200951 [Aspergillus spectabilis]